MSRLSESQPEASERERVVGGRKLDFQLVGLHARKLANGLPSLPAVSRGQNWREFDPALQLLPARK